MADIIAIVDDPSVSAITVTTGTGSTLSDGGLALITGSTLSNPQTVETMSAIGDVDTTTLDNGAVLVYKTTTNKWTSTTVLDAQDMEAGEF
jgi:translation initiation factor 2 gamma subunit (eIF-2gamma)